MGATAVLSRYSQDCSELTWVPILVACKYRTQSCYSVVSEVADLIKLLLKVTLTRITFLRKLSSLT